MQNFFVAVHSDGKTFYLKATAEDRETLLKTLPVTLGCPHSAIKKAIEVGKHEFEKFPASVIKTSGGLFKLVIDKTDGRYGAPMGRGNVNECTEAGRTFDRTVTLDGQGYDQGGAYWGTGRELRVTYNEDLTYVKFYRK